MKNVKIYTVLCILLLSFVMSSSSSFAASLWSKTINDSMTFAFPGVGWGSVTFTLTNTEESDYNLTYKIATSYKRQVDLKDTPSCPYSCDIRFTNYYTNDRDGSNITGITSFQYSSGSYWTGVQYPGTKNYKNPTVISSTINSRINIKTTVGLFGDNGGQVFLGSKDYYGDIR